MKIGVADNNNQKFTKDLIEHWQGIGHEVRYEPGASEYLAQWADAYYIDTWDNNIHYLFKLYHGQQEIAKDLKWNNKKKPRVVVRALDWEVWIGLVRDQSIIDWVDSIIFIAPHIQKRVEEEMDLKGKGVLVRPGVNTEKFKIKTKQTDGYQIGMVLGDMWKYKNHMGGLDIFTTLYKKNPKWRFHIRGQHENSSFDPINFEHYLDSRGIREAVTLYPSVEDMNEWYEGIDYLLHPGQKEAFCYAVGEAASKGIKPVVNNFYGAEEIWPSEWLYNTHAEAVHQFSATGSPVKSDGLTGILYRQFIEERYSLKRFFKEMDEQLGL